MSKSGIPQDVEVKDTVSPLSVQLSLVSANVLALNDEGEIDRQPLLMEGLRSSAIQ